MLIIEEKIKIAKQKKWKFLNLIDLEIDNSNSEILNLLSKLIDLECIDLSFNNFTAFPEQICELTNLRNINLRHNLISEIPESIKKLKKLEILNLNYNRLWFSHIIDYLFSLKRLKVLLLGNNKIYYISNKVSQCSNLEEIYLSNNSIISFPKETLSLNKIKKIWLDNNEIKDIPAEIKDNTSLKTLYIYNNPVENLPPEIFNKNQNTFLAIKNWFEAIDNEGFEEKIECRIIIVGAEKTGKTTLFKLLSLSENINDNDINISTINNKYLDNNDLKLCLWDFNSREIIFSTYKFFFSNRCLYLLLWNANSNEKERVVFNWLDIISTLSDKSSIVLVMNKRDIADFELNQYKIKNEYPNILAFTKTNLNASKPIGLSSLIEETIISTEKIKYSKEKLPKKWYELKNRIENLELDYIDYNDYLKLIQQYDIDDNKIKYLIDYLHDIGIALHYSHPDLINTVILNKNWLLSSIYLIIYQIQYNKSNYGKISLEELYEILESNSNYSSKKREIVTLMEIFEICFKISDSNIYIFPSFLDDKPIPYNQTNGRVYEFKFNFKDFLPDNIFERFICRINKSIFQNILWKNGCVLKVDNNIAIVNKNSQNKDIHIKTIGDESVELYLIIRHTLKNLLSFTQIDDLEEHYKCYCDDSSSDCFFDKGNLIDLRDCGNEFVSCKKNSKLKLYIKSILKFNTLNFQYKSQIISLIAQAETENALAKLQEIYDNNDTILLQSRFNRINNDYHKGIVSKDDHNVEIMNINNAILKMIKDIKY